MQGCGFVYNGLQLEGIMGRLFRIWRNTLFHGYKYAMIIEQMLIEVRRLEKIYEKENTEKDV